MGIMETMLGVFPLAADYMQGNARNPQGNDREKRYAVILIGQRSTADRLAGMPCFTVSSLSAFIQA
jgi:hypothetical protein